MITSLLIANRGEIACRIIRTCRRLGIRAVAVYSDADVRARHVELADEAIRIGPPPASESYLVIDAIIAAARRAAADAIHPGYGFLAENGDFAQACATAGILFIGPTPAAIAALGNKRAARELAAQAGVPTIPGYDGADQSDAALRRAAGRIGWPLIVKAASGGGGKGMRVVQRLADLDAALAAARHEARQAFGSDELILEHALPAPRHIEFQIFGDQQGNLIHLGERECSIQRRHQKVIEEAPAPELTPALRTAIGAAAVAVGRAAGYKNAGTVEFLLDRDGGFYFLEINTRLQVEHPITECTTGLDLVEWQIRVTEGQPLPLRQEDVRIAGHAIEARLYAEDPANGFLPATGEILLWREPAGEGVRVDSGIRSGDQVSIYYDPLLAKIVVHGPDRAAAIRRLVRALETTALLGIQTNLSFLHAVLHHPAFQAGAVSTTYLAEHFAGWAEPADAIPLALFAATLAQWVQHPQLDSNRGYWRNNRDQPQIYRFVAPPRAEPVEVRLTPARQAATFQIALSLEPDVTVAVELNALEPARIPVATASPALRSQPEAGSGGEGQPVAHDLTLTVDGHRQHVTLVCAEDAWWVQTQRGVVRLRSVPLLPEPAPPADAGGSLRAPMPGTVLAVLVDMGQRVTKGDALLKLEAMKMEHTIRTAADGVVEAIYFAPGATVEADALLVKIREND
ncbi:MAG TPA: biotin carboxylase N-terminal domain-containing protein [Roseiflexaceae bacterium]|jgi:acetyl-CoA carboxylase biotin carboxylase subunit